MAKGYKTGGRQTGTPNKRTAITENIEELVLQEFQKIPAYIESLNNKERLEFIIKLLPYAVPKYTHKTISDETPELPIFDQIQIAYFAFVILFKSTRKLTFPNSFSS